MAAAVDQAELIARTERWFLRRGLPHLIDDYRAGSDVFTRVVVLLVLIALVEVGNAARLEWRWWQNALALVGALGLLVALYAGANALRGRPPLRAPDDVGPIELRCSCSCRPSSRWCSASRARRC